MDFFSGMNVGVDSLYDLVNPFVSADVSGYLFYLYDFFGSDKSGRLTERT